MGKLNTMHLCFLLCTQICSACELLEQFEMRDMFKEGNIMIGGIFPIFNKQENVFASFKTKPLKPECKG